MKVAATVNIDLTPAELGKTLANSTPEEFSQFWFAFYEHTQKKDLMPYAEAMARESGNGRKIPLTNLYELMKVAEYKKKMEATK